MRNEKVFFTHSVLLALNTMNSQINEFKKYIFILEFLYRPMGMQHESEIAILVVESGGILRADPH